MKIRVVLVSLCCWVLLSGYGALAQAELIDDENKALVAANCTVCHSDALIVQARLSREKWLETIRWMQAKHNLWALGAQEDKILDYLSHHYGAGNKSAKASRNSVAGNKSSATTLGIRRKPLDLARIQSDLE